MSRAYCKQEYLPLTFKDFAEHFNTICQPACSLCRREIEQPVSIIIVNSKDYLRGFTDAMNLLQNGKM